MRGSPSPEQVDPATPHPPSPGRRPAASEDTPLLRRLWPLVRPYSPYLVLAFMALVIGEGCAAIRPLVMGHIVDRTTTQDVTGIRRGGALLALLLVGAALLTAAQGYFIRLAGLRLTADLRSKIFEHVHRFSQSYLDRTPVGHLASYLTKDVDAGELLGLAVLGGLGDLLRLGINAVAMLILDVRLSLAAFVGVPIVAIIVRLLGRRVGKLLRVLYSCTAQLGTFVHEQVNGIAVVQVFSRQRGMAREFEEIQSAYRKMCRLTTVYELVPLVVTTIVSTVCTAGVLWLVVHRWWGPQAPSLALIVTFSLYIKQLYEPLNTLSAHYGTLQHARTGLGRIMHLLDTTSLDASMPSLAPRAGPGDEEEVIALDRVSFSYRPGSEVLQEVSLVVKRGEKVALVGATGAGKSTVSSLVLRLYDANAGAVRVLGRDVRAWDPGALRRAFAVVPQEVFLFSGTLLDNIAVGEPVPDRVRAEEALRNVGALELCLARPGGLDTAVDPRGANFSAGERQLLAMARALYRDAPILLLDEATASVDSRTEARLQAGVAAVLAGRTALVIAHRLSTVQAADRIVVFHKGRAVESGTHAELLAHDGVYAKLHRLQSIRQHIPGASDSE